MIHKTGNNGTDRRLSQQQTVFATKRNLTGGCLGITGSPANSMGLTQNFSVLLLAILLCRGAPVCAPCHCVVLLLGRHVCAQNTSKQRNNKNNCPSDRGTRNLQVNFGGSIKKRLNATELLILSPTPYGYSLFITKKRESLNCPSAPTGNTM